MEGLCGLKGMKIGGATVPFDLIRKALDTVDATGYRGAGLWVAYNTHFKDTKNMSFEQWEDWYFENSTEQGKVSGQSLSAEDVGGPNPSKAAKKLANLLAFKGYSKSKGKRNRLYTYAMQRKIKSLKLSIISRGPLEEGQIQDEIDKIEFGFKKQKVIAELEQKQATALRNVGRNLAAKLNQPGVTGQSPILVFTRLFNMPLNLIADNSLIAQYQEIQERFHGRGDIDFSSIEELEKKAAEILKLVDSREVEKIDSANEVLLDDSDNTQVLDLQNQIIQYYGTGDFDFSIAESEEQRFIETFKDIKPEHMEGLTRYELATIINGFGGLEKGYIPSSFYKAVSKIKTNRGGHELNDAYQTGNAPVGKMGRWFSDAFDELHSLWGVSDRGNVVSRKLHDNAKWRADELLGLEGKPIGKIMLNPLTVASEHLEIHDNEWRDKGAAITSKHKSYYNLNRNKRTKSHSSISLFLYEREAQSNVGSPGLVGADAALEKIYNGFDFTKEYDFRDITMLRELQESLPKRADGSYDIDKWYNDMTEAEKAVVKFAEESAIDSLDKISIVAVRRGEIAPTYTNYTPHSYIDPDTGKDMINQSISDYIQNKPQSTKAGSLYMRTERHNGIPRLYDPIGNIVRAQKGIGLEYYMGQTIKDVLSSGQKAYELAKASGNEQARETALGVLKEVKDTIRKDVTTRVEIPTAASLAWRKILRNTYAVQLASVPRMMSEASSNLAFALIYKAKEYSAGVQDPMAWDAANGLATLTALDSRSQTKLYGRDASPHLEKSFWTPDRYTKLKYLSPGASQLATAYDWIAHSKIVGGSKVAVDATTDFLLTGPDRMITRPLFFGVVQEEFGRLTNGKKLDYDLVRAQTAEGKKYRKDNADAIRQAVDKADMVVIQAGASTNVYMGFGKMQYDPDQGGITNAIKSVQYYMMRFSLFEFSSAQSAIKGMQGKGELSEEEGAKLMAAITARMMLYAPVYAALVKVMMNLFGLSDDEEQPFLEDLKYSFLGSLISLGLMRNMGVFRREALGFLVEAFNEEYLEGLRNGEKYDPWDHSLVFRLFSKNDFSAQKGLFGPLSKISGPLRPLLTDMDKIFRYGTPEDVLMFILTYGGRLPFPKDVNRIYKQNKYQDVLKDRSDKKQ